MKIRNETTVDFLFSDMPYLGVEILGVYFTYNVRLKNDLNFDGMLK